MICKKSKYGRVSGRKFHIIFNFHVACILFRFRSEVRRRILCNECTTLRLAMMGGGGEVHWKLNPLNAFQCAIYILPMRWWGWRGSQREWGGASVGRARLYVFPFNRLSLIRMYTFNYFSPYTQIYVNIHVIYWCVLCTPKDGDHEHDVELWTKMEMLLQIAVFSTFAR